MRKSLTAALALTTAAGMFALAGCSAPAATEPDARPTASATTGRTPEATASTPGQSLQEACSIANEAALSVQGEASEALSNPSDPALVSAALEAVETRLREALTEITNPEVTAAITDVQASFATLSDLFASVQAGAATQEQAAQLQTSVQEMQASVQAVRELCT